MFYFQMKLNNDQDKDSDTNLDGHITSPISIINSCSTNEGKNLISANQGKIFSFYIKWRIINASDSFLINEKIINDNEFLEYKKCFLQF